MKFSTLPTADATPSVATGSPLVACFPLPGIYSEPPAVADNSPYPKQFTLAKMAEMWWRWKTLSVAFDSDFTGPVSVELVRRNNTERPSPNPPLFVDERQLIFGTPIGSGGLPGGAYWEGFTDVSNGIQTRTLSAFVRIMGTAGSIPNSAPTNDTAYYFEHSESVATYTPAIEISLAGFWDAGSEWTIFGTSAEGLVGGEDIMAVFDGVNLAMVFSTLGGNPQNCSVEVGPIEFFPWANPDGSDPTWDSTTGARN